MPQAQVSASEVDALLQSGTLYVEGFHAWKQGANKAWCRLDAEVLSQDPTVKNVRLRIVATYSPATQKCDFSLLWNGTRVRALCINGSHTNRHTDSNRWLRQMHKHKWTDDCLDRFAYTPTDITAIDVNGQFAQFCQECGIACTATFGDIPATQGDLLDEL